MTKPPTPQPAWHPIEDGLPEDAGWYLVTIEDRINYDPQDVQRVFFIECISEWDVNPNAVKILAWMPLPQPYQRAGGSDE